MFNLDDVETKQTDYSPLPDGDYLVQVTEAESRRTKKGDGSYVKATFSVLDGDYTNRKVWHNFNTTNPNPQAVDIGLSQLKAFFVACGITDGLNFEDEADIAVSMEGQSCVCTVRTKEREGYAPQNDIVRFKPYEAKKTKEKLIRIGETVVKRKPAKLSDDEIPF